MTITKKEINALIEINSTLMSLEKYADLPEYQMEWVKNARKESNNLLYQNKQSYLNDII